MRDLFIAGFLRDVQKLFLCVKGNFITEEKRRDPSSDMIKRRLTAGNTYIFGLSYRKFLSGPHIPVTFRARIKYDRVEIRLKHHITCTIESRVIYRAAEFISA